MVPRDTDPATWQTLVDRWRALGIEGRIALADRLCQDVENVARSGIASRHPTYTASEVQHELARRRYGPAFAAAFQSEK